MKLTLATTEVQILHRYWPTVRLLAETTTLIRCFEWTIPYSLVHPHMKTKKLASSPWARSFFCKQSWNK